MKSKYLYISIVGIITGALTVYAPKLGLSDDIFRPVFIFPGLFFALAACLYLACVYSYGKLFGFIVWSIASIVAYNAAFWATFFLVLWSGSSNSDYYWQSPLIYLAFFIGGFLGAFITLVSFRYLIVKITFKQILYLSLCGGALGMIGVYGNQQTDYLFLFVFWHAGMLMLIMYITEQYILKNQANQVQLKP